MSAHAESIAVACDGCGRVSPTVRAIRTAYGDTAQCEGCTCVAAREYLRRCTCGGECAEVLAREVARAGERRSA